MKKLHIAGVRWSAVLCIALFLAMGGYLLYSHIGLNEVSSDLLAAKKELSGLEG